MNEEIIKRVLSRMIREHIVTPTDAVTLEKCFIKYAKEVKDMLLAEIKDEPVPEDIERDKLIKSLQESNRELAHRISDLMQWREHYKRLYEELLSEVLDRVNRE